MKELATQYVLNIAKKINPAQLTGPIFSKELRVASRKRRNYFLRFFYILILTVFILIIWGSFISIPTGFSVKLAQISQAMSQAGKFIVSTIIWYQFILLQIIAVVMLSTAISDEIYHKTLGLLMTTPITSFQIVSGKLLSRLLQLFVLLGISFPLLAILRVFGGIPWSYVLSSFCITFTAVLFAGSLSLYFSINTRQAYAVILKTIFVLGVIYFFIPFVSAGILILTVHRNLFSLSPTAMFSYLSIYVFCNPFLAMYMIYSRAMEQTIIFPAMMYNLWPVHCIVMGFWTLLILGRSVAVVRKQAFRQATGWVKLSRRRIQEQQLTETASGKIKFSPIRAVKGEPLVWKEMAEPLVEGGRKQIIIAGCAAVVALLISYYTNSMRGGLREYTAHTGYSVMFVMLGLVTNIAFSATSITSEKESMSWPILLTTPLRDAQIVAGKWIGAMRRCLVIWIFLAAHLILFTIIGYIHPAAIIHMFLIVAGVLMFLNGSGLYFGSIFRRTTSAVVANFSLVIVLWLIVPLISDFVLSTWAYHDLRGIIASLNPVWQTMVIMQADSGADFAQSSIFNLRYNWPIESVRSFFSTVLLLLGFLIFYSGLGIFFAWRAKCNLRRNIF